MRDNRKLEIHFRTCVLRILLPYHVLTCDSEGGWSVLGYVKLILNDSSQVSLKIWLRINQQHILCNQKRSKIIIEY